MKPSHVLGLGAAILVFDALALAQPAPGSDEARILAAVNAERAAVGSPPLSWDDRLAAAAASYGPTVAASSRLLHSPRSSRPGQSENLWRGMRGAFTLEQMVGKWGSEKARFRPGIYPNVSSTGDPYDVSHYTQMIWPTTTRIGCATYRSPSADHLICRFSPRGNVEGQRIP